MDNEGRILYSQTPSVGLKASQFPASLGAVPLEGLVSAHTQQPILLIYTMETSHPASVGYKGAVR